MESRIMRAESLEGLAGQLAVQTLEPVPMFPKEDFILTVVEPLSAEEAAVLLTLDSEHNPLLADLWRDDVNDDLVTNS